MQYEKNVGKKVTKISPKLFKSGNKINTVKDVILHPILGIAAYQFEEDNSLVECRRCRVIEQMQIGDENAKPSQ